MKLQLLVAALLVLGLTQVVLATQDQNPPFPVDRTITLSNNTNSGDNTVVSGLQKRGCIIPCDVHYYLLSVNDVSVGDYLYININFTSFSTVVPRDYGTLFVKYHDLALPIVPFSFPDEHNYDRTASVALGTNAIDMEITCHFKTGQYILGITGGTHDRLCYNMTIFRRYSPITQLIPGFPFAVFNETRAVEAPWLTIPPQPRTHWPVYNYPRHYRFYRVTWDRTNFREGTFMVASLSRVQQDHPQRPVLRALYGGLPQAFPVTANGVDSGSGAPRPNDLSPPCLSYPNRQCTDLLGNFVDCECEPQFTRIPDMPGPGMQNRVEFACNVTISPCRWQYGDWYLSVWYPPRLRQFYPGYVNYTIQADVYAPRLTPIQRNVTYKGFVDPQLMSHYRVLVPFSDVINCDHHFHVHLNNVRGGTVALYVHQSPGQLDPTEAAPGTNLAGDPRGFGREACVPAEYECRTCSACNLIVPKCELKANYWYIGVAVVSVDLSNVDRLPISYTIRANWVTDPPPRRLLAGKPVSRYLGENLYDFYMIDLPETIDTWLFVELYARHEQDEVVMYMKHGELPGENCYAEPDFWCVTGDGQESCSFMINVCNMEPGPLYITVYGLSNSANAGGAPTTQLAHTWQGRPQGTTYYEVPVEYTLWADFDVAMQIESGISYTHCVHPDQYAHYYLRADNVMEGCYMSVETTARTNPDIKTFVNYNFLAGEGPCYDHLFNLTGPATGGVCDGPDACGPELVNDHRYNQAVLNGTNAPRYDQGKSSLIMVSHCDFRSGVWYIAVKGGPLPVVGGKSGECQCYTLTATVWDAPAVKPLAVGETISGAVTKFTRKYTVQQYDHYKLASQTLGKNDLIVQLTYVQNGADFESGHEDGQLQLFVNRENLATEECWRHRSVASTATCSTAKVVVPHCQWYNFQYWVSVRSDGLADSVANGRTYARYTLRTSVEPVEAQELHENVGAVAAVKAGTHKHFFFECPPGYLDNEADGQYLMVDFYTNRRTADTSALTLSWKYDCLTGQGPCFESDRSATSWSISWQFEPAELRQNGKYYLSVYNPDTSSCGCEVEFTLTVSLKKFVYEIAKGNPGTGHIHALTPAAGGNAGRFSSWKHMYKMQVPTVDVGESLTFEVSNVARGSVIVYINYGSPAGPCPAYEHMGFCRAAAQPADCAETRVSTSSVYNQPTFKNWCEVRIPYCVLKTMPGTWYFTVMGVENQWNDDATATSIGYTFEANIETPVVNVYDRFLNIFPTAPASSVWSEQQVPNSLWHHFSVRYQPSYVNHYLTVEVTNIKYGTLDVLFSHGDPADLGDFWNPYPWWTASNGLTPHNSHACAVGYSVFPWGTCGPIHDYIYGYCGETHHTPCFLCRHDNPVYNLGCFAEVPYCLFQVDTPDQYYISVTGNTAHAWTEYSFAAYLRPPVTLNANTEFNSTSIAQHFNGYSQMYILRDVTTEVAPSGQILEVFFYRIRNLRELPGNDMNNSDFYVWLNPNSAAGPHRCMNKAVNWAAKTNANYNARLVRPSDASDNHGWCVDHVETWNRINVAQQWKNVTVWNCALRQANGGAASNPWFMTVDPYTPQLILGVNVVRVNYSVRWRVRDTMGTPTDLSNFTNVADAPLSTLVAFTQNQKESYRTYFVDINLAGAGADARWKLVIQTIFTSTVATTSDNARVYIQYEDIANPGPCNEYSCAWPNSVLDCASNWRFQKPQCALKSGTYYITVRQYDEVPIAYRFRIRTIQEPRPTININSNPQICFNGTTTNGTIIHNPCVWRFNVPNGSMLNRTGVEGENYHHYSLDVAAADIAEKQSLIVNLTNINVLNTGGGLLYSFVRKGYEAGAYRYLAGGLLSSEKNDHLSDFCYSFRYACSINSAATVGTNFCVIQIPHCQLEPGTWYISVFNPDLDLENVNSTNSRRGYQLEVGYMVVAPLQLGVSYNITQVARFPGAYYHHRFEVTEADLVDYFDHYLSIRLYEIGAATTGSVSLFVNKGELAGHHNELGYIPQTDIDSWNAMGYKDQFCLSRRQQVLNCPTGVGAYCTIYFVPCGGEMTTGYEPISALNPQVLPHRSWPKQPVPYAHMENKLEPGVYYVSVWVTDIASYKLRASLEPFDIETRGKHRALPVQTVAGKDHRATTTNFVWTTEDRFTKNLNATHPTLQWWQVNLVDAVPAGKVSEQQYVHIQLEDVAVSTVAAWVRMDVFRNDCASWYSCDAGNDGLLGNLGVLPEFSNCQAVNNAVAEGVESHTELNNNAAQVVNQCALPAAAYGTRANNQTGWCHIDATGNGPCQLAKAAAVFQEYRIRIWNPSRANYTVKVWLNQTTETTLTNGQNYSSVLYRWQYEHFTYTHAGHTVNNECTMRIDVYAYCGAVESCVNRDSKAGVFKGQDWNERFQEYGSRGRFGDGGILYNVGQIDNKCHIDCCATEFTSMIGRTQNNVALYRSNCQMFLDTCTFHPGTYSIVVRGVAQEFPTFSNSRLWLPAKYVVTPTVICRTAQPVHWMGCDTTVTWTSACRHDDSIRFGIHWRPDLIGEECKDITYSPKQYFIDVDTWSVGTWLRFQMSLPDGARRGEMVISHNRTVSYTGLFGGCPNTDFCRASPGQPPCCILIPMYRISSGRWFIWANSQRGSKINVSRWTPTIQFIVPNWPYKATIDAVPPCASSPFTVPLQCYRMILDGENHPDQDGFYLSAVVTDVRHGQVRLHMSDGLEPYIGAGPLAGKRNERNSYWGTPVSANCMSTGDCGKCAVSWERGCTEPARNQWHFCVEGVTQQCPHHAIQYTLEVHTHVQYKKLWSWRRTSPQEVHKAGEKHLYKLGDFMTNDPVVITPNGHDLPTIQRNHTILSVFVQADSQTTTQSESRLKVSLRDGAWATGQCDTENFGTSSCTNTYNTDARTAFAAPSSYTHSPSRTASNAPFFFAADYWNPLVKAQTRWNAYERICQFKDLRVTVEALEDTKYCIEHRLYTVELHALSDGVPMLSETIHPHLCGSRDFFLFTVPDSVNAKDAWLYVMLESIGSAEVWVNHGSLADTACSVAYCSTQNMDEFLARDYNAKYAAGSLRLEGSSRLDWENLPLSQRCMAHVICDFKTGDYYMTVVSQEQYTLTAAVVTQQTQEIVLGSRTQELSVPFGTIMFFKFDVPEPQKDQYLQVNIADVHFGGLVAAIRYEGKPAPYFHALDASKTHCMEGIEDPVAVDWDRRTPGYSGSILGDPQQAYLDSTHVKTSATVRYSHCQLDAGTYYVSIYALPEVHYQKTDLKDGHHVSFKLEPVLINYGVTPFTLALPVATMSRSLSSGATDWFRADGTINDKYSLAVVRVSDVEYGRVTVRAKRNYLASPSFTYGGECKDWNPVANPRQCDPLNPVRRRFYECSTNDYNTVAGSNYPLEFGQTNDRSLEFLSSEKSCAFVIDTCDWAPNSEKTVSWYFAVTASKADWIDPVKGWEDTLINYSFNVEEKRDWTELWLDYDRDVKSGEFAGDNWDYHHYKATTGSVRGVRFRFVVDGGAEGMWVNVRDHECEEQAQWQQTIWCDADYHATSDWKVPNGLSTTDDIFCDIQVPSRASHPFTSLTYYITVNGRNAAYKLSWHQGWMETCDVPHKLEFCSGIVDYPVWIEHDAFVPKASASGDSFAPDEVPSQRADMVDWTRLDEESRQKFNAMYDKYRLSDDFRGVTPECNATLRRFACYESFKRCDNDGFSVGTCRIACESVCYFCATKFETIGLSHFECASDRYLDHVSEHCTGHREEIIYPQGAFPKTPGLTLLESSASVSVPGFVLLAALLLQLLL
eukprot:CAMPEP_0177646100 /NCGR_PEP_ID=MMETSP0447-20121125/9594_1 /TAXON_ID=0 /ORGANISM="Stygamoeba regulata, Strain BSH-02190019" /LENGTH=3768 /DNA_ID=CAMNT_0019148611 /DNA_START=119 /DNA_END=11425 /DNA_ORIENTATION=+